MIQQDKKTALILSGGGARAAYQVGVLSAIADILPKGAPNPFEIVCGTSAGAINATVIATHASYFRAGVRGLEHVWKNFHAAQVYRTDPWELFKHLVEWSSAIFFGGIGPHRPMSLLDNAPLLHLLSQVVNFRKIQSAIDQEDLYALSITALNYSTAQSVSFYQGAAEIQNWQRARRVGVQTQIELKHLLASSAIPAIFPAIKIGHQYYGDGAMRQLAPISPALHLGADRVLVIGVRPNDKVAMEALKSNSYPSIARIAGHVLNSAFLDSLEADIERLTRINRTIGLIPETIRQQENFNLKPVDILVISPSQSLDAIATRHVKELPKTIRFFLSGSGATRSSGSSILSYLLFEQGYCQELIRLGYQDAIQRKDEIIRFLSMVCTL